MHPRLAELVIYADLQRKALLAAVSLIPEPLRDRRLHAECWSVAEVLEHLHRVETGITRLLTRGIERAKAAGAAPEHEVTSVLGSLDSFGLTQRFSRVNAPEPVMPRGELTAVQAVAALEESRRGLLAAVALGDGLALGAISYPHALIGMLNLYQWILFVGQHEARHVKQIQELGRGLIAQPR
jgi:hypothetical protein